MNGPASLPFGAAFDPRAPWNATEPQCQTCLDAKYIRGPRVECPACGRGVVNPSVAKKLERQQGAQR